MRFDRLRLRNFKPHTDTDLRLEDGVTVIHGLNGSGKSSLLEASFFALYGSKALDSTLDEVVTTGMDETDVELWFTHAGEEYHITRALRRYGDSMSTTKCVLEGPTGTIEGATDVRRFVSDELLRMDSEAFRNCAYIRQGEVNRLINASASERQKMIDDLLQLGKLEEYRDRAGDARLGVEDVLADRRGGLNKLDEQIAAKEEEGLHERLNGLETELSAVGEEIERFEANREEARKSRDEARAILEEAEEREAELEELAEDIENLEAAIQETRSEREALMERITDARDQIEEKRDTLSELAEAAGIDAPTAGAVAEAREALDEQEATLREELQERRERVTTLSNQSESLAEKAEGHRERADAKRERASELEQEAADAEATLAEQREQLTELAEEREQLVAEFAEAPTAVGDATAYRESVESQLSDLREEIQETAATLTSARDSVEEAEELLAEGKCPECGQPVEDSPHVDTLAADRERVEELAVELGELNGRKTELETELDTAESLVEAENRLESLGDSRQMREERIEELEAAVESALEDADERRREAEELAAEAEAAAEAADANAEEAAELREEVASREATLEELEERRERLDRVESELEEIEETESQIERLRDQRESKAELLDERRERLADRRAERDELREAFDRERVEAARDQREKAVEYLEQVTAKLDELSERRDELTGSIGSVKTDIEQLETLREEREALAETVADLESVHAETEQLEQSYGDLRAELRQQNVESLERMLNETFDLVYGNDAYSHIELDGEYELTVYQKDGTPLAPEQLSGGERALFNLSLRCAIYRLLSEGIEGAAPTPPLILDEPTVFLDSGHISRLVDLVEEMRGFGVRQILIVSHDDELVGAADSLVTVEKNTTTNRSTVEREAEATVGEVATLLGENDD
ncbi:MAG: DNA double-strand break repair ATPase Rad50 [Halolamina sp.]|uniref:DNA double-strand break repair ATPase Rad50 n=1 Tax=Halolamina sp. TaxID=1940283 RepID=UPI002FC27F94